MIGITPFENLVYLQMNTRYPLIKARKTIKTENRERIFPNIIVLTDIKETVNLQVVKKCMKTDQISEIKNIDSIDT